MPDDVRLQIAELTQAYQQGHLSERTFRAALLGLGLKTDQITQAIETQGGAVFQGEAKADRGGKIVGRDDYSTTIIANPDRYPPEELLTFYYRALANDCCRLPLGIIDTQFIRISGEQPVPLPDIYVDLDAITPTEQRSKYERAWAQRSLRGEYRDRVSLLKVITRDDEKQIVLLGDPGSGKTTFVNYLTFLLATDDRAVPDVLRGQLVVRLILREVIAQHIPLKANKGTAQMLWNALHTELATQLGTDAADVLLPHVRQHLLKEGGLILLDGLDEVPEAQQRRRVLLEAVSAWVDCLPTDYTRVLITARPYAYADKRWHLKGFSIFALAPFSEEQVQRFIDRWYRAVRVSLQWNEATARAKGEQLRAALHDRPYLGDLASRPLLLTLMATLHSSWGQLPEDRANLYEESVKLLLGSWQRAREIHGPDGMVITEPGITQTLSVGEDRIRAVLETLAYSVHQRQQREVQTTSAPADISESEVLLAFKPLLREVDPDELLRYLKYRAGLVVEYETGVYAFLHRSFQEYLAACYLANQVPLAEELCRVVRDDPAWWREVFVLAAGKFKLSGAGAVVAALNALLPAGPDELDLITDVYWRSAALVGQTLTELRLLDKSGEEQPYAALLKRTQKWLIQWIEEGHLSPGERAEAGDVLGQLGDPRFDTQHFALPRLYRGQPEELMGFVKIPAGQFVMGSRQGNNEAYDDEYGNPDRLTLPYDYWIARYPVTVAQYRAFVEAKGYEEDRWWTGAGWQWCDSTQYKGPRQWTDQLRYPNRPVLNVTWFESIAYSAWLSDRLKHDLPQGYIVRLPTEAEWEKSARSELPPPAGSGGGAEGEGRRYPWGNDDWDESRANMHDSRINRATTVGMFPHGATSNGLHDLSGNVWEWCLSVYQPYPYQPQTNKLNDFEVQGGRVLRGGSWALGSWYARCAYRLRLAPDEFNVRIGFRLMVSPASSAF